MRFSIIVPVYNVEKYLSKCLDSIINQTNKDYEILIINDGSTDNSQEIINKYVKDYPSKVKSYIKENGGLSDARNFGVKKATGEYLIFVDSDDFLDIKLLENLENIVQKNEIDLIGYSLATVDTLLKITSTVEKPTFFNEPGQVALEKLISSNQYFESACYYAYNREFWIKNNFEFAKDLYHEDFGLTPIVLLTASKVTCINFIGYYYYQTPDSITRTDNLEKEKKKAFDLLIHFDNIRKHIDNISISSKTQELLNSYIANALLYRFNNINKQLKKDYKQELKNRKIYQLLFSKTLKQKIKKFLIMLKLNLF